MTPERWQQIKLLLQAALERKASERDTFLDEACANDPSLRQEIESLIVSHERAGGFIESPAFEVMAESLANQQSVIGEAFGPYKIVSRLGSGGMGDVYLAEDTRLSRRVGLKVLPAHFTRDDDRVRRFQQEARAASALNHPNIITIYEIGEIGSSHFIATEFIQGETLRRYLTKMDFKIADALEIAAQVASALCAAHEAGIVHRDIKPENIMVRSDHIVKVLDFGLVKLTEKKLVSSESPTLFHTAEGMVMGTAHYMSPEQARGLVVDARTDIWSLAAVLYEMIAGRVPFEGTTSSDVIASILEHDPQPLARYKMQVPPELEWIVKKALRKDRDERYQTAREFLSDLRNLKRQIEFEEDLARSTGSTRASDFSRKQAVTAERDRATAQSYASHPHSGIDSLAILPLLNNSSDPGLEYFSDGITESIINSLSQLPELRVMAWSTVSRYRSQTLDPREVGRTLNVRAVLTGRLMQAGERLSIKTELVDVPDGSHLWGETYSFSPSDILSVQATISTAITEKLLLRLTAEERKQVAKRYTDNVEAYHAYLRGRHCWNKRTDEGVRKAIEHFRQAIDVDPSYALAYAGLADSYLVLGSFGIATLAPHDAFPKAREAASRALDIDYKLGEAHASLAYILGNYDWNWPACKQEFEQALSLKPNYATAHHWYGFTYLAAMSQLDQAIAEARHALELDPLSLPVSSNIGLLLYLARRYDEAIVQFQKTLELDQTFVYSHFQLALAYEQVARYTEAIAEFQKAIALSGTSTLPLALLGHTYAVSGRRNEAQKILGQLNAISKERYVSPYRVAAIHVGLGDREQAFAWLERAYEGRDGWLVWLQVDPVLSALRSDDRFTRLLERIGLLSYRRSDQASSRERETAYKTAQEAPSPFSVGARRWWTGKTDKIVAGITVLGILAVLLTLMLRPPRRQPAAKNFSFTQVTDQSGPEFFPSLSPDGKSIVYASRALGNWDIYLQRIGGRNAINLTKDSTADDTQPTFSPDGERMVFRSEREGGGVFLMGATGESVTRVSDFGYSPSWSPDGEQILVGTEKIPQPSTRPTKSQLWKIDVRTRERKMISEGDALQPNYSPHKQRIAYWSRPTRAGQREDIWTIPAEGGEAVPITNGSTIDLNPVWSPDGNYLYFSSSRGGSMNVWRVPIDENTGKTLGDPEAVTTIGAASSALHLSFSRDGQRLAYIAQEDVRNLRKTEFDPATGKVVGQPVSITGGSMQLWFPDASPDGEWLTACSRGQQRHVYIIRTDGKDLRDLTDDNYRNDGWPRWSPDGKRIAFTSRRTGNYELWVINRDGSGLQQLTQSGGGHYSPWSRDGKMIAYSIHTPKNDCVILDPEKPWGEQTLNYLSPLPDATLSFEGWSWSSDGKKLAGIRHLPNGVHSGIGSYDLESKSYDWLTDFGDWPLWLKDDQHLLFVSQGKLLLFDTKTRRHQPVFTVTDQDVDIGSPALSPDNRTIYFAFVAAEADVWIMTLQ